MQIIPLYTLGLRLACLTAAVATGFSTLLQQPLYAQAVSSVKQTTVTAQPTQLPATNQKIGVVVYPFRLSTDQPSQPKNILQATTDYTAILFEVLRNSGWFIPSEYSNAGNLLNQQRDKPSVLSTAPESGSLPASQGPTVILEAGLFSQDSRILTDEIGSLDSADGGSHQYRQDRATVFLRALSAQSGKILKTLYWTRTVHSQLVGSTTYRYVLVNQSTGPRTGGTTSTPPDQLAVVEAMKQAVLGLIVEGIRDGLWAASDASAAQTRSVIAAYEAEKMSLSEAGKPSTQPHKGRSTRPQITPSLGSLCLYGGLMRYHGDYVNQDTKATYGLSVEAYATPRIGVQLNAATGTLASQRAFSTRLTSIEANLIIRVLPYRRLTPVVFGGAGLVSRSAENPFAFEGAKYVQYQGGIGLQYTLNNTIGFRTALAYTQPRTDMLDGKRIGSHNDFYVRTTLGLLIHFGQHVPRSTPAARN